MTSRGTISSATRITRSLAIPASRAAQVAPGVGVPIRIRPLHLQDRHVRLQCRHVTKRRALGGERHAGRRGGHVERRVAGGRSLPSSCAWGGRARRARRQQRQPERVVAVVHDLERPRDCRARPRAGSCIRAPRSRCRPRRRSPARTQPAPISWSNRMSEIGPISVQVSSPLADQLVARGERVSAIRAPCPARPTRHRARAGHGIAHRALLYRLHPARPARASRGTPQPSVASWVAISSSR